MSVMNTVIISDPLFVIGQLKSLFDRENEFFQKLSLMNDENFVDERVKFVDYIMSYICLIAGISPPHTPTNPKQWFLDVIMRMKDWLSTSPRKDDFTNAAKDRLNRLYDE